MTKLGDYLMEDKGEGGWKDPNLPSILVTDVSD